MSDDLREREKVKEIAVYLFTLVSLIYLLSVSPLNIHYIEHYYQRYEVTRSIVENFDVSIPNSDGRVIKGIDNRTYSLYGLGWSVLAIPFYIVGNLTSGSPENLVSMLNLVAGAATVSIVFLFAIALGYSRRGSLVVAIFYGLGTFAWPLAKQPFDHIVETLFVLLSLYFAYLSSSKNDTRSLMLSALCLGIAMNTRLVSMLALPPVVVMMGAGCCGSPRFSENSKVFFRKIATFMLALLPFCGLTLWYNYYRFGSIFETGFQLVAARTDIDFFSGTNFLIGLNGFLASPGKGYFYYSPIAVFFFYAIIPFSKKHRSVAISFILLASLYLLFLSRMLYWHGDWAWGPRFLLAITPFMMIPMAELLDSVRWRKQKPLTVLPVYVVFALSILLQISAVSVHFFNYFANLNADPNVRFTLAQGKDVPIITEPPPEVYFTWTKSPILLQFKEMRRIGNEMMNYRHKDLPRNLADYEKTNSHPSMSLFDLWWVQMYFVKGSYAGFVALPIFLLMAGFIGVRVARLSRRNAFQLEHS